ncbi:MAG: signal peptidase I [Actinobacteria bacterium]|nr:signal peptidase I [Actinomycetota bacterium]
MADARPNIERVEPPRGTSEAASTHSPARRVGGFIAELPVLLLVAFVLALLLRSFLVQAFYIPSESMVPTLEIGDRVLVNRLAFRLGEPERGEIVVFSDEAGAEHNAANPLASGLRSLAAGLGLAPPSEQDFIKRVIGLPGDTIEIIDGVVHINGEPLPESQAADGGYLSGRDESFMPAQRIPDDEYFVMGDNRPRSSDSRSLLGTISRDQLIGRAFVLVWPFDRASVLSVPDYDETSASTAD